MRPDLRLPARLRLGVLEARAAVEEQQGPNPLRDARGRSGATRARRRRARPALRADRAPPSRARGRGRPAPAPCGSRRDLGATRAAVAAIVPEHHSGAGPRPAAPPAGGSSRGSGSSPERAAAASPRRAPRRSSFTESLAVTVGIATPAAGAARLGSRSLDAAPSRHSPCFRPGCALERPSSDRSAPASDP